MAEAMWLITHDVASDTGWQGFAQIVVGGTIGVAVYVAVLVALNAPEVAALRRLTGRG
jgi:hypothetical protein